MQQRKGNRTDAQMNPGNSVLYTQVRPFLESCQELDHLCLRKMNETGADDVIWGMGELIV